MGGTPLRREYRRLMVAGTGGGERSKRGGGGRGSRVSRRRRLPWTEGRRRMLERAPAVGSAFKTDLGFVSSGSRQMLQTEVSNAVCGVFAHPMLTQASRVALSLLFAMRARAGLAARRERRTGGPWREAASRVGVEGRGGHAIAAGAVW